MQQGGGELVIGEDGAITVAGGDAPAAAPRGGGGGRGRGGHQGHREPAVVRRHGTAPERTITRDSLREVRGRRGK
jgi:hypothetical protein